MKALLEIIANKKLTAAFDKNDMKAFHQIASKLYRKARTTQDKKEYLLAECLKLSNGENIDEDQAMNKYKDIRCQELALKARENIQMSEKFLTQKDPLVRFDMKETALNATYSSCMSK